MLVKTKNVFQMIFDSIPNDFLQTLESSTIRELTSFAEMTGIPLSSSDRFRKMAALLILSRYYFIIKYEDLEAFKSISISNIFVILSRKYPKVFVSSILEIIACKSDITLSSLLSKTKNSIYQISDDQLSDVYVDILDQKERRKMGQFWTPENISDLMIDILLEINPENILDPCIGPGTFIKSLKQKFPLFPGTITSLELHPLLFEIANITLYNSPFSIEIMLNDFLTVNLENLQFSRKGPLAFNSIKHLQSYFEKKESRGFDGIICNPPFSRHHVLSMEIKQRIGKEIEDTFGGNFNRISSLFMYFILKSLTLLLKNGRMVFITPTISFESRNSKYLKAILKKEFTLPLIIVFHHSLNIFPSVDTAACIFIIEGKKPKSTDITKLLIVKEKISSNMVVDILNKKDTTYVTNSIAEIHSKKQFKLDPDSNWTNSSSFLDIYDRRNLVEISDLFRVMRGVATGNNSYFTFTDEDIEAHNINRKFIVPTLSKTRHIQKLVLTKQDFNNLRKQNRKVWLLYLQECVDKTTDKDLLNYIEHGIELNVYKGSLVKTRKIWYSTEKRDIPIYIFTYLSRGNPRFILNEAEVRPLNTFLMIFPKKKDKLSQDEIILFWAILNSKNTLQSLRAVGRSYGGDTLKVEPKEMMKALILNPFTLSQATKKKLLELAYSLRKAEKKEVDIVKNQIDKIIDSNIKNIGDYLEKKK